jgi:hypothetical protein
MSVSNQELYSRGVYRLEWDQRRDGTLRTPHLQILWYDRAARRNRSKSTGTSNIEAAEDQLDRFYLKRERGRAICPTCGQPTQSAPQLLLIEAIADYLLKKEALPSISSVKPRLAHVLAYLTDSEQEGVSCISIDDVWVEKFRTWASRIPIAPQPKKSQTLGPKRSRKPQEEQKQRARTPGTIEASVRQLAAVINYAFKRKETTHPATFKVLKPTEVSRTPTYRSDVNEIAAMFKFAMKPGKDGTPMRARRPLLRFLQISVITWARPDAAHDFSTVPDRKQWNSRARVVDLNPKGRTQTRKYRPQIPVGEKAAALINSAEGYFVGVESVKSAFSSMLNELGMPREGETGMKLIRRSISTLVRRKLGEEHFAQVEMMLGHRRSSTSDLYALFEPGVLGRALEATNEIIAAIEARVPGAFHRTYTGHASEGENDNGT